MDNKVISILGFTHERSDKLCMYCQDVEVDDYIRVCDGCKHVNLESLKGTRELAVLFHGANVIGAK